MSHFITHKTMNAGIYSRPELYALFISYQDIRINYLSCGSYSLLMKSPATYGSCIPSGLFRFYIISAMSVIRFNQIHRNFVNPLA